MNIFSSFQPRCFYIQMGNVIVVTGKSPRHHNPLHLLQIDFGPVSYQIIKWSCSLIHYFTHVLLVSELRASPEMSH